MDVVCVNPLTDPLWLTLIQEQRSSVFHTPEWMRVLTDTYGFDIRAYLLLNENGAPEAGMPFCRICDLRGDRIVALPFCDYLDPLAASADQWNTLLEQLTAEHVPVIFRCLHNVVPLADERVREFKRAKWHGVDLRRADDALWMSLDGAARRAIQKAQRSDIEILVADSEAMMRAFFEMHLRVRKYKYQLVAQPYSFFANIWRHLLEPQKGFLLLAAQAGDIVAGIVFLCWKDTVYYKFNASSLDRLDCRPNDLLIWTGMQRAKAQGYAALDFGLSDWDQTGLLQYKRKFASVEATIHFMKYDGTGETPTHARQAGALFPQLTDLFTNEQVPDSITEKAGDALYRFFA